MQSTARYNGWAGYSVCTSGDSVAESINHANDALCVPRFVLHVWAVVKRGASLGTSQMLSRLVVLPCYSRNYWLCVSALMVWAWKGSISVDHTQKVTFV